MVTNSEKNKKSCFLTEKYPFLNAEILFSDKRSIYQQGLFRFPSRHTSTDTVMMLFSTEDSTFADYFGSETAAKVNQILLKYSLLI